MMSHEIGLLLEIFTLQAVYLYIYISIQQVILNVNKSIVSTAPIVLTIIVRDQINLVSRINFITISFLLPIIRVIKK